jgi:hypothetical protein
MSATTFPAPRIHTREPVWRRTMSGLFGPVREHPRAWLACNAVYFGSVLLGAIYAAVDRAAQQTLLQTVGAAFSPSGTLGPLVNAYASGQLASAVLLTFGVNLVLGSLLYLTLPSLVIPFAGLAMGVIRGLLWGILFSPTGELPGALWPHVGTLVLEGEAYVLAILGVWLWWWPVVRRPLRGFTVWRSGLLLQPRVYAGVATMLAVAAVYEAIEVIYILPLLAA